MDPLANWSPHEAPSIGVLQPKRFPKAQGATANRSKDVITLGGSRSRSRPKSASTSICVSLFDKNKNRFPSKPKKEYAKILLRKWKSTMRFSQTVPTLPPPLPSSCPARSYLQPPPAKLAERAWETTSISHLQSGAITNVDTYYNRGMANGATEVWGYQKETFQTPFSL